MDWSGVDYVMFLSAVWTLILTAPIHYRASIGEQGRNATFLQIWWRNKLYILDGLRVSSFQQIFIFGWTIPLNESMTSSYYYSLYETVDGSKSLPVCVHHSTAHIHRNGHLFSSVKEEVWPSWQYMLKQDKATVMYFTFNFIERRTCSMPRTTTLSFVTSDSTNVDFYAKFYTEKLFTAYS